MSTLLFLVILIGVTLFLDNHVAQRQAERIQAIWDNPRPRPDPYNMPAPVTPSSPSFLSSVRELLYIHLYGLLVFGVAGGLIFIVSHCLPSP